MFKIEHNERIFSDELIDAVETGNFGRVKSFMNKNPTKKLTDSKGTHLLHLAAEYDHMNLILYLIQLGCDTSIRDSLGRTPCNITNLHNHVGSAEIFIRINTLAFQKELRSLARKKRAPVIRNFYKKMMEDAVKMEKLAEVLEECKIAVYEVVRLHDPLLTKAVLGISSNYQFQGFEKYLVKKLDLSQIKILFHYGSQNCLVRYRCLKYIMNKMPKYQKSQKGRAFLKGLFDWEVINKSNLSNLESALMGAKIKSVQIFLGYNFHKIVKEKCGIDLLACIFGNSNPKVIQLLENEGVDIDKCLGCYDRTPLHYAAESSAHENVRYLLKRGADPDAVDYSLDKPLCAAFYQMEFYTNHLVREKLDGQIQCFKLLLQTGGNLLLTDIEESSTIFPIVLQRCSRYWKSCINKVYLLLTHLYTYHALDVSIKEYDKMFPLTMPSEYEQETQSLYQQCQEQLALLKSHEIVEVYRNKEKTVISMITILAENPRKIARYIKRKHLHTIAGFMKNYKVENLNEHYYDTLKEHIRILKNVHLYRDAAIRLISECSGIFDVNHIVVEHIVNYLTLKDLSMFR